MIARRRITLAMLATLGLSLSMGAVAGGGGRGGDSSMNPFTGNSYAYFNGGQNLGEQGMNIPWRKPVPQSTVSVEREAPNATKQSAGGPTRAFRSVETSGDQNTGPDNK